MGTPPSETAEPNGDDGGGGQPSDAGPEGLVLKRLADVRSSSRTSAIEATPSGVLASSTFFVGQHVFDPDTGDLVRSEDSEVLLGEDRSEDPEERLDEILTDTSLDAVLPPVTIGSTAYYATVAGRVVAWDLDSGDITRSDSLIGDGQVFAAAAVGDKLWLAAGQPGENDTGRLIPVDPGTWNVGEEVTTDAGSVALAAAGDEAFVSLSVDDLLHPMLELRDGATGSLKRSWEVSSSRFLSVLLGDPLVADSRYAWVGLNDDSLIDDGGGLDLHSGAVARVDLETEADPVEIEIPKGAPIGMGSDGDHVAVTSWYGEVGPDTEPRGMLWVFDVPTGKLLAATGVLTAEPFLEGSASPGAAPTIIDGTLWLPGGASTNDVEEYAILRFGLEPGGDGPPDAALPQRSKCPEGTTDYVDQAYETNIVCTEGLALELGGTESGAFVSLAREEDDWVRAVAVDPGSESVVDALADAGVEQSLGRWMCLYLLGGLDAAGFGCDVETRDADAPVGEEASASAETGCPSLRAIAEETAGPLGIGVSCSSTTGLVVFPGASGVGVTIYAGPPAWTEAVVFNVGEDGRGSIREELVAVGITEEEAADICRLAVDGFVEPEDQC